LKAALFLRQDLSPEAMALYYKTVAKHFHPSLIFAIEAIGHSGRAYTLFKILNYDEHDSIVVLITALKCIIVHAPVINSIKN
jgi:hypothetical protein